MHYSALPTDLVNDLRNGKSDIHGQTPERAISDGVANPCRHCLRNVPEGKEMLILAHRPFPSLHPYAESGPVFLCADACERGGGEDLPPILTTSPDYLIKGYSADDRIVYGTGAVVPAQDLSDRAAEILENALVAYVHVRSSRNNCYLARVDRD